MQLVFGKSRWEMWDDPLETFLRRAKLDGFAATEIALFGLREAPAEVASLHAQYGLRLIGQVLTQGATCRDHLDSLEEQFARAIACGAAFVNSHAGRDIFSFEENCQVLQRAAALSRDSGLPFMLETHRGRPTYSAIETRRYLEALPELRLTADFSHWMVVHESGLSDQPENLDLAIRRSGYIHARVGYAEGPQVPDPRAPEWAGAVAGHLDVWQRLVDHHRATGAAELFITPEFGPPQYMHTAPYTRAPAADAWEVNVYMKSLLEQKLRG